ncbi:hypothetical protein K492DRAFT_198281 [Lichtheimia hyalospora FSU 10163]|nr:hypothetical protein K492DRAFT_198281 [Lichtheimia hyalospora FSU 10163]
METYRLRRRRVFSYGESQASESGEEYEQTITLGDSNDDFGDDGMEESDSSEEYQQVSDQDYGENSNVDSDKDEEQDFEKPLYPHLGT